MMTCFALPVSFFGSTRPPSPAKSLPSSASNDARAREPTLAVDTLVDALARGDLEAHSLAGYERRWREYLDAELSTQLSLRVLAQRMRDEDIESLFELALTDGVMPIVRRTATFNRHRQLILALFKHPPARQVLFRSMVR